MEASNKLLTWGLGGHQLRILDRQAEAILLAAESFGRGPVGRRPVTLMLRCWKRRGSTG